MFSRPARSGRFAMLLAVAAIGAAVWMAPASGQSGSRTISLSPADSLVDLQYVAVSFAGLPSSQDVRIRECPAKAKVPADCNKDSPYAATLREGGDSRLTRTTVAGTGDESFIVKAGEMKDDKGREFKCDLKHKCNLVVFELNQNDYTEIGFDAAASVPIGFAKSTIACPAPKGPGRVAGFGSTGAAVAIAEWQAETCGKPLGLQVSYIVQNSPEGKRAFIDAVSDADFAVSGIGLSADEKAALTTATREVVQVPLTVGSLSMAFNYWEDFDQCDTNRVRERVTSLRMSPRTLAYVMTGRISDMSDPMIAADNAPLLARTKLLKDGGVCDTSPTRLPDRFISPVGRADQSAATWLFSSWMIEQAGDAWTSAGDEFQAPTEVFPSYNAVLLKTGSAAVARQIRTADGDGREGDAPNKAWIGFVDTAVTQGVGLPSMALLNPAGQYVTPSKDNVLSSLTAAALNEDGTVTPNLNNTGSSDAYPLLSVTYLITDKHKLTTPQADVIKAFAAYAITKGQEKAEERGYVPLPTEMQTSAAASIATITGTGGGPTPGDDDDGTGGTGTGGAGSSSDDDDSGTDLSDVTDDLLGGIGSGSGSAASGGSAFAGSGDDASSPIAGGGLAAQAIGPAGGPAGVVRALTVFLGFPLLIALGLACVFGGRALSVMSDRDSGGLLAFLPASVASRFPPAPDRRGMGRRSLGWRRAS